MIKHERQDGGGIDDELQELVVDQSGCYPARLALLKKGIVMNLISLKPEEKKWDVIEKHPLLVLGIIKTLSKIYNKIHVECVSTLCNKDTDKFEMQDMPCMSYSNAGNECALVAEDFEMCEICWCEYFLKQFEEVGYDISILKEDRKCWDLHNYLTGKGYKCTKTDETNNETNDTDDTNDNTVETLFHTAPNSNFDNDFDNHRYCPYCNDWTSHLRTETDMKYSKEKIVCYKTSHKCKKCNSITSQSTYYPDGVPHNVKDNRA